MGEVVGYLGILVCAFASMVCYLVYFGSFSIGYDISGGCNWVFVVDDWVGGWSGCFGVILCLRVLTSGD